MTTIHTVNRLTSLKAGERFTYYRGNIDADIISSYELPAYKAILEAVRDSAAALAKDGTIKLETAPETVEVKQRNGTVERARIARYIAVKTAAA